MTVTSSVSMAVPAEPDPTAATAAAKPGATTITSTRLRLAAASRECSRLLQVGAVLGPSFTAEEVLAVLRQPIAALLQPLEEALRSGLLVVTDQALRFPDELVWQEVLGTLAEPVLGLLRHEVDILKQREAAPGKPDGPSLTAGELRIAQLVARGLTNQQIAKRVFLSPHTVNYHLRQVFRKLEINSRAELAALVHSEVIAGMEPPPE